VHAALIVKLRSLFSPEIITMPDFRADEVEYASGAAELVSRHPFLHVRKEELTLNKRPEPHYDSGRLVAQSLQRMLVSSSPHFTTDPSEVTKRPTKGSRNKYLPTCL